MSNRSLPKSNGYENARTGRPVETGFAFNGRPIDNNLTGLRVHIDDITLQLAPTPDGGLVVISIEKGDLVVKGQSANKLLKEGIEKVFPKI